MHVYVPYDEALVTFVSDSTINGTGFKARWNEIPVRSGTLWRCEL